MKRNFAILFLLSLICLVIVSCASTWPKDFGSYEQDQEIKTMFESHEYIPDYNYFYTGFAISPEAVVGIKGDYELVRVSGWGHSTDWRNIEPGTEKLKDIVEAMYHPTSYGYVIYAPDGEKVGVMYSQQWGPVWVPEIRLKNGNQLEVVPHKYNSTWAPAAG